MKYAKKCLPLCSLKVYKKGHYFISPAIIYNKHFVSFPKHIYYTCRPKSPESDGAAFDYPMTHLIFWQIDSKYSLLPAKLQETKSRLLGSTFFNTHQQIYLRSPQI